MRKFWKIFGITLGSLVGLVLIVASVLVYVVFTPKRLTPIVNEVLTSVLTCEYEIGDVELTFFSTFPEFGVRIGDILLRNPMEGAQNDTVLAAKVVVARIDVGELLCNGMIDVHEATLSDVSLNAYIAADGRANFDVIASDSTQEEEKDTTSNSFLKGIDIHDLQVGLRSTALTFVDEKDSLSASCFGADIALGAKEKGDDLVGRFKVALPALSANYKGVNYATDATIRLDMPFEMALQMEQLDLHAIRVRIDDAQMSLNQFELAIEGEASYGEEIGMDLRLKSNDWKISEVLSLVPGALFTMPEGIRADGELCLTSARVHGIYNDSVMPLVEANLTLRDATAEMADLPYVVENVEANIDALINLNDSTASNVIVNRLYAETKQSSVEAKGEIDALLGDMRLDLQLLLDVNLPDAQYFMPENMHVTGRVKGPVEMQIRLEDLMNMELAKGKLKGDLAIMPLEAEMDSMVVKMPKAQLAFAIPNSRPAEKAENARMQRMLNNRRKKVGWLEGCLKFGSMAFSMTDGTEATFGDTDVDLQLSDILQNSDIICADLDIASEQLKAKTTLTDSLGNVQPVKADISAPTICGFMEYDFLDAEKIPTLSCTFDMKQLDAAYDTITIHACDPKGNATITGGRQEQTQPKLFLSLNFSDMDAAMGSAAKASTGAFALKASARHTADTSNILLEWQPRLDFDVHDLKAKVDGIDPEVKVPQMTFTYSNKEFLIDTARVQIGRSDFGLSGKMDNIGPWLKDEGLLKGDFHFTSEHADIDELLAITSGMGADGTEELTEEEKAAVATETIERGPMNPYMVPKGVDVTLNTTIRSTTVFGKDIRNLGGMIYVRDGVVILEEVGFISKAANLKLTAMYKTPRKNHLFVGLDYHMTDIDIAELVDMIPQVDTLLPMLRSFKGGANFHLAAETYMNGYYELKPSTTRGACSIDAKDLTLMDGETFTKIARLLTFNKKTENKIDSISAEITLRKKEIEVYPFLITMDKWMAAVGGQHNLDMTFNYHVSLLNPLYLGVDVSGSFDDLDIKLAKCRYAKDFKPIFTKTVDTQSADIRRLVREAITRGLNTTSEEITAIKEDEPTDENEETSSTASSEGLTASATEENDNKK